MSGECQDCDEHTFDCECSLTEEMDDHLIAKMISDCRYVMRHYPTASRLTACYNLTEGILRVFSICNSQKEVMLLVKEFYEGLKESVKKNYEDR